MPIVIVAVAALRINGDHFANASPRRPDVHRLRSLTPTDALP
jgi:hypothetical protein